MIVRITIFRGSFVFSQSRVKVSASLTNVGSLAVGAFDLVICSLFVGVVPVFNVGQQVWATRMLQGCRIREMVSEVPLMKGIDTVVTGVAGFLFVSRALEGR